MKDMQIELRKLSELRHPDRNARMHPDKQIAELKRSLKKDGQTRLMVIDEDGVIWIGNGLYMAMIEMGYTEAYCIVKTGMSELDKKKMMFSDNRIFDLGVDDMNAFDDFISELGNDLDIPGYDPDLIESLVSDETHIDDILSSYGLITEEKKDEISCAVESYKKEEEERHAQPTDVPDTYIGNIKTEQNDDRFVICPKCGEKIWL